MENKKFLPKLEILIEACREAIRNFEKESEAKFNRRLLDAVEAQRNEWLKRLGKNFSGRLNSVKQASSKLRDDIDSNGKRERLIRYLKNIVDNSSTEGLRVAFQFDHLNLESYIGPQHEVYAVLIEELVSALINRELFDPRAFHGSSSRLRPRHLIGARPRLSRTRDWKRQNE